MKQGTSLQALAQKIESNEKAKRDLVADTRELRMTPEGTVAIKGKDEVAVSDLAHRQIGDRLHIPAIYYDRMRGERPELLATNVNSWFDKKPRRQLLRTYTDPSALLRAFLSDRYQRRDHTEMCATVFPVLAEQDGLDVASCEMTERRLYLKFVTSKVQGEVKAGDVIRAGVCLTNSEVGLGSYGCQPFLDRLICTNGMIVTDSKFRMTHVGGRISGDDDVTIYSDDTLKIDDQAVAAKLRDVLRYYLSQDFLNLQLDKFREAADQQIEGHPAKAVEVLGKRMSFSEDEQGGVLRYLTLGHDLSKWGLANAVTRLAQDAESYDRATELETAGGKLIDMPASEWKAVALAA
jgi:Domain of unknown function (DUF932)